MKNTFRQIAVVVVVLATITINILADALPINGLNTGTISDTFHVYFVPAGYVFAIWGLIYIGLLTYTVFQALPAQKDNPRLQATGWWVVLGGFGQQHVDLPLALRTIRRDPGRHAGPACIAHRHLPGSGDW